MIVGRQFGWHPYNHLIISGQAHSGTSLCEERLTFNHLTWWWWWWWWWCFGFLLDLPSPQDSISWIKFSHSYPSKRCMYGGVDSTLVEKQQTTYIIHYLHSSEANYESSPSYPNSTHSQCLVSLEWQFSGMEPLNTYTHTYIRPCFCCSVSYNNFKKKTQVLLWDFPRDPSYLCMEILIGWCPIPYLLNSRFHILLLSKTRKCFQLTTW